MIRNYLKTAWRNIWRNKSFSFLNIFGLTAGTVCCLYIVLYVTDQYGYDEHHADAESIYRIRTFIEPRGEGKEFNTATSSPPIANQMKQDFPEVVAVARVQSFADQGEYLLSVSGSDNSFYEDKGYLADSTFFQIFNYKFIEGSALHSLDEPYTVVLSSTVAHKLFGKNNALNEQIKISNRQNDHVFKVTGVFDEKFGKSHLRPHFIMNMNSGGLGEFIRNNNQWSGQNFIYSYVKLNPRADARALEAKLPAFLLKYGAEDLKKQGVKKHLFLQNVTDINLHSKGITNQVEKVSNSGFLYLLLTIACFIQLIACVNFINLTTARSVRRAKEIGVRKVVGAVRSSLVRQFLSESIIISFIAVFLAIPAVMLLLSWLNTLTGADITASSFYNLTIILIIIGLGLVTGLLAGFYPALYLSGFRPVSILKGSFSVRASSANLRKGLVVFQFAIAIILIISAIIISRQLNYMRSTELGFNKNEKIVIPFKDEQAQQQFTVYKNEIIKLGNVNGVAGCVYYPTKSVLNDFLLFATGKDLTSGQSVKINRVDQDFFNVLDIPLLAGRYLTSTDTTNQTVVNEKVLSVLKINKDNAIGASLFSEFDGNREEYKIIGVTKDYNFNSLKEDVRPIASFYSRMPAYMIVESKTADYNTLLSDLGAIWKKTIPQAPFQYTFLDDDIQKQYTEENTLKKISDSFTLLAILISCLGLFGLAMFTAQQRIKEIGVRKVLGASVTGIATMLSKDFLKLVVISIIVASPIAWWAMNKWLEDFAFKIDISWWVFVLAGVSALFIALVTVSFQAIKAAIANPMKSLRTE
jgi:putative ABC transport system permease protein